MLSLDRKTDVTGVRIWVDSVYFGGDFAYGGILNPLTKSEIVNVYETDEYLEYCLTMRDWTEKGFMPMDSLRERIVPSQMFQRGELLIQWSSVSPTTEYLLYKKRLDFPEKLAAVTPNRVSTGAVQEIAWGISVSSKKPEKAMAFLDLLYKDKDLANLITYGREGIDYEILEGDTLRIPSEERMGTIEYETYFSLFGDQAEMYHYGNGTEPQGEDVIAFSEQAGVPECYGYTFRAENLAAEIEAIHAVTYIYRPVLEAGLAQDVEATLAEFNRELRNAGIDRVIEENRRQYKEFLNRR